MEMELFKKTLQADITNQLPNWSGGDVQELLHKVLEVAGCIEDLPHVEPSDLQPPLKKATAKRFVAFLQTKYGDQDKPKETRDLRPQKTLEQSAKPTGNKPKVPTKPNTHYPKVPPKPVPPKPSSPVMLGTRRVASADIVSSTKPTKNYPKVPPKPKSLISSPHGSPKAVRTLKSYPAHKPISESDTKFLTGDDTCGKLDVIHNIPVALHKTKTQMEGSVSPSTASCSSEVLDNAMVNNEQKSSGKVAQSKDKFEQTVKSLSRSQALRVKKRPSLLTPFLQSSQGLDDTQGPGCGLDGSSAGTNNHEARIKSEPNNNVLDLSSSKINSEEELYENLESLRNENIKQRGLPHQVVSIKAKDTPSDPKNAADDQDPMISNLPQYQMYMHSFSVGQKDLEFKVNDIDGLRPSSLGFEMCPFPSEKDRSVSEGGVSKSATGIDEESIYAEVYGECIPKKNSNVSYINAYDIDDADNDDDHDFWGSDEFDSDGFSDEGSITGTKMDEYSPEQKQAMKAVKRQQIATELLTTEHAYVKRLHLIDQEFHLKIVIANRSHHMFPDDIIPQMFSNIKSIYQFHNDFLLPQLEKRMANWAKTPKIGDLMSKFAPFLKLYSEYVKNFDHAINTINKWQQCSTEFADILADLQKSPECGMLALQHHMLEPIQRVPRYKLLLQDYLKHLEEDSEDRPDTERALELVTTAAAHANQTMEKPEKFWRLLELNQMFRWHCDGVVDLTDAPRELIKEGQIFKISARKGTQCTRYVFLFTDLLLVCTDHRKLGRYHVHNVLKVDGMKVLEGDNPDTPLTFHVETHSMVVELKGRNQQEKLDWFSAIQSVIQDRCGLQQSTGTNHRLGHHAPRWVKDQNTNLCMVCASLFSLIKRRHHCRCCGRVVCGECSPHKVPLPYQDNKPDRVCGFCYEALKLQTDELQVKGRNPSIVSGMMPMSSDKNIWEQRWFVLYENFVLCSFETPQDTKALTSACLPDYVVTKATAEEQIGKEDVIKISHPDGTVLMYIDNTESQIKWLEVLQHAANKEFPTKYVPNKKDTDDLIPAATQALRRLFLFDT